MYTPIMTPNLMTMKMRLFWVWFKTLGEYGIMGPLIHEFNDESRADEMVCNDWAFSCRNSSISIEFAVG